MLLLPALAVVGLLAAAVATVVWPTRQARPRSLLARARGRAIGTVLTLALLTVATLRLESADAERTWALQQPVGPGWSPDAGLLTVARAGALGVLATVLGGIYVLVAFGFDALAGRKLRRAASNSAATVRAIDVGVGDQILERPRTADYRSDASTEVSVRGNLDLGRRLLRRAALVDALVIAVLVPIFLLFAMASLALALN